MKILHTSDWHLGKSLYDFSLLDDSRRMLDFLLDVIESEKIDAVIIAGDIYDRPVPPAEAVRLYDYFLTRAAGELHVPVLAVAGNHDSASRLEFGSKLCAGSGYYVYGSAKPFLPPVTLCDEFGDVNFYAIPWLHPAEARGMFGDAGVKTFDDAYRVLLAEITDRLDKTARNIAVAHGFFAGLSPHNEKDILVSDSEINIGGMDIADSSYFSAFDYTALGHLHAPQRAGADNVRYSGSPLKYSLSEERQRKSCAIIELKRKGDLETRLLDIPATHDVRSVTGSFDDLMEPSFHTNNVNACERQFTCSSTPLCNNRFDDYVFANITDSGVLYPMEKLRTLFPNLLGLRFISEKEDFSVPELQSENTPKLTVLELFSRFYKDAKSVDITNDKLEFLRDIIKKSELVKE